MKTNNNTAAHEAAKNLAIYNEMTAAARRAFEFVDIPSGQYTPAQINRLMREFRAVFRDDAPGIDDPDGIVKIEVDGFACSYPLQKSIEILERVATAYEIPTAARATFERAKDVAEIVAAFDVPAAAAAVAKVINKKDLSREALTFAYLDTERRALVATNGKILTVTPVPSLTIAEGCRPGYLIAPDLLKGGRVEIDANNVAANGGRVADSPDWLKFPAWASVFPALYDTDAITFDKKTARELAKAVAAATKYEDELTAREKDFRRVVIFGDIYADAITVRARREVFAPTEENPTATRYDYKDINIKLSDVLPRSFVLSINGTDFAKVPALSALYIPEDTSRPAVAVSGSSLSLLMPAAIPDNYEIFDDMTYSRPQWAKAVDPLADLLRPSEPAPVADTIESESTHEEPAAVVEMPTPSEPLATEDTREEIANEPREESHEETPRRARRALLLSFARHALKVAALLLAVLLLTIAPDRIPTTEAAPAVPTLEENHDTTNEPTPAPVDSLTASDTLATVAPSAPAKRATKRHPARVLDVADTLTTADTISTADTLATLEAPAEISDEDTTNEEPQAISTADEDTAPTVEDSDEISNEENANGEQDTDNGESNTTPANGGNGGTTGTPAAPSVPATASAPAAPVAHILIL